MCRYSLFVSSFYLFTFLSSYLKIQLLLFDNCYRAAQRMIVIAYCKYYFVVLEILRLLILLHTYQCRPDAHMSADSVIVKC